MSDTGIVVSITDGVAAVSLNKSAACQRCGVCKAAADGLIYAKNICAANVGDTVLIEFNEKNAFKAGVILYGLPCVFFVAGVYIGQFIGSDTASFLIGTAFVAAIYFFIRKNSSLFGTDDCMPTISK